MIRKRVIFRRHYSNALTIPLLLNVLESDRLSDELDIMVVDSPVTVGSDDLLVYSIMTPFLHEWGDEIRVMAGHGAKIVVGGPHCHQENHELLLKMGASSVCAATAETALVPVLNAFQSGTLDRYTFWPGRETSAAELSAYLPLSDKLATVPPLELMRGCGYSCPFCATAGKRRIMRSRQSIESYLDRLKARHLKRVNFTVPSALDFRLEGINVVDTLETLFESCRERNLSLLEFGIFPSEIRPETVTRESIRVLKHHVANRHLTLGVQSGSRMRLGLIRRSVDEEVLAASMETILSEGFGLNLDLIVGYPDEDDDEFTESVHHLVSLRKSGRVRVQVHRFFPLGNSVWEWRKPSQLTPRKFALLDKLEQGGVISKGWRINETQWQTYFSWLRRNYPEWAAQYH